MLRVLWRKRRIAFSLIWAYTLTRQAELFADLLEGHFRATDTEEVLDDVALTVGQRR